MTEKVNGWLKTALMVAAIAVPFLIGWGALDNRVNEVKATQIRVLAEKADKATVDVQYSAILRELVLLNQRLDRLESRR